ncbi:AsnB Asparagine synthase (glutamine-hydrolyzing) [Candidatus Nanopelagicaceae bacterium]
MCGISGLIASDSFKAADRSSLLGALQCRQNHRGPDLESIEHLSESSFFIHNLLSIIGDPSESRQPIYSWDKKTVLVFNGEIYNWLELCDLLPNGSEIKRKGSDSRLLVEGINHFGPEKFIGHVRGMFSIALNHNGNYYLIRDRFGQKPLKYSIGRNFLVFASEIGPVARGLAAVSKPLTLSDKGLEHFVACGYFRAGDTFIKEIKSLERGNMLKVSINEKFFHVEEFSYNHEKHPLTFKRLDLKQGIIDSVREQLHADVPVGIFMSGGVDSSLLTAIAYRECGFRGPVMSISFPTQRNLDESLVARKIADQIGIDLQVIEMNPEDALVEINRMEQLELEPLGDPSILPTMFLSRKMSQFARVAFSGDGADELFFGYTRYKKTHDEVSIGKQKKIFPKIFSKKSIATTKIRDVYFRNQFPQDHWWEVYSNPEEVLASAINDWWRSSDVENCTVLREQDLNSYLPENILVKLDRSTMAYSLEARLPFLDERLADAAMRSSYREAVQSGVTKAELKTLLKKYVAYDLVDLPKRGFTPPYEKWLRNELREWADQVIQNTDWSKVGIEPMLVQEKWENFVKDERNDGFRIWAFIQVGRAIALRDKWSLCVN